MLRKFFLTSLQKNIQQLLYGDLSSVWIKLERHSIIKLNDSFVASFVKKTKSDHSAYIDELVLMKHLVAQLKEFIGIQYRDINQLKLKYSEYSKRYKRSTSNADKQSHIIEFSKEMGAGPRQLEADKKSFQLWFDHDAITDRFHNQISIKEKILTFSLTRLARLICELIATTDSQNFTLEDWKEINLEAVLMPLFNYKGDSRIKVTAFKVMVQCVKSLNEDIQKPAFSENILRYVYRSALDHNQDIWIQTEALELLSSLSPENFKVVFIKRFEKISDEDDIFIRHHSVILLQNYYQQIKFTPELLQLVLEDKSAYVRQAISKIIGFIPLSNTLMLFEQVFFSDSSPQVRAALLLTLSSLVKKENVIKDLAFKQNLLDILLNLLDKEKNLFVLRILLQQIPLLIKANSSDTATQKGWIAAIFPVLSEIHQTAEETKLRRWAAKSREWIWCYCSLERTRLLQVLQVQVKELYHKDDIKILKELNGEQYEDEVTRLLALIAQEDDGFDLDVNRNGFSLYRKPLFVFRWWRVLHELRHSSIDKRQAFSHTTGRLSRGKTYIPSSIKAELSLTKVPGEPFYLEDEDGWRHFLPLVDDIISLLDPVVFAPPIKIVTSEGVTHISPPANPLKRFIALSVVTIRFDYFARLRNWEEGMQGSPNQYISALEKLDIHFEFQPHQYPFATTVTSDSSVSRFFNVLIPVPMTDLFARFKDYFYSIYENNLIELLLFLSLGSAYFIGQHVYVNQRIKQARRSMGIVIGGWGTRGKSGTERLKAALFNALGFNVVSKTTGCEAMFLHSYAHGQLREMFLFRPYDKATIWEQGNVLRLAHKMGTDVFLWECMGLTPSYVQILQRQWMQDDIATITNTYPDHEDLQGPAGHNIPEVMTRFIPKNSVLITSEEQMLPILKQEVIKQNSRFVSLGWQQAGLITDDVMNCFPYDEHPYNIALVLSMAQEFGIPEVYALREMARRVVPDLGVLKTYPSAKIQSRILTFVMGMSANERYGALGNWRRTGFDQLSMTNNPETWVSVLINNRADRIPRSRVFADILVKDISVDSIYLIGTNLHGFMGYLNESWELLKDKHTFSVTNKSPQQILMKFADQYRIPTNEQVILKRMASMLSGLGEKQVYYDLSKLWPDKEQLKARLKTLTYGEHLVDYLTVNLDLLSEYKQLSMKIDVDNPDKQLDERLHHFLWQCFSNKIVIIEDEHASGDEIINTIVQHTPPGLENKIMGMQNIKGTGLDFVYRWLYWDFCNTALEQLCSDKELVALEGLKQLVTFQEYSLLCEHKVKKVIYSVKEKAWAQREHIQAELELVESRMKSTLEKINSSMGKQDMSSRWKQLLLYFFEELLDTGDAIKRRKKADRIYQELINQRISHARAAQELKKLNARQKGGWLARKVLK